VAVLGGGPYSYFRYETHLALMSGLSVYDEIAAEFADRFDREHPAVEAHRCDDAEFVFVMMGSFATKARAAVDCLRAAGRRVGLLRPRLLRPFPAQAFVGHLTGKRGVAVIDQNLSLGKGGVLHTEVTSALYGYQGAPLLVSFIGGLGGRDITPEEFFTMVQVLEEAAQAGQAPTPRLLFSEEELHEMRKLQTLAHVERNRLMERS
jgi:pyruvate ferredoxin oxidoreductase alpha subunit